MPSSPKEAGRKWRKEGAHEEAEVEEEAKIGGTGPKVTRRAPLSATSLLPGHGPVARPGRPLLLRKVLLLPLHLSDALQQALRGHAAFLGELRRHGLSVLEVAAFIRLQGLLVLLGTLSNRGRHRVVAIVA